jgi:hypothetical protein
MKRTVFAAFYLILVLGSARAEETALVPKDKLRFTIAPSFGFQLQEWDWTNVATNKVMLFNAGLGVEYAPADWINAQLFWLPGVNVWSRIDGGSYGRFSDIFLGFKAGILAGDAALFENEKFKNINLSAALGIKIPLPATGGSREPDQHLWGSVVRVYFDYIFNPLFTLNMFVEGIYYPRQYADTPNFISGTVGHYLDLRGELEGRFQYPLQKAGLVLYWGVPLSLFVAPVYNALDPSAGRQMAFSAGAYFGLAFSRAPVPLEVFVKYSAPIAGTNDQPIHRISLIGRVSVNIGRPKKPAAAKVSP